MTVKIKWYQSKRAIRSKFVWRIARCGTAHVPKMAAKGPAERGWSSIGFWIAIGARVKFLSTLRRSGRMSKSARVWINRCYFRGPDHAAAVFHVVRKWASPWSGKAENATAVPPDGRRLKLANRMGIEKFWSSTIGVTNIIIKMVRVPDNLRKYNILYRSHIIIGLI